MCKVLSHKCPACFIPTFFVTLGKSISMRTYLTFIAPLRSKSRETRKKDKSAKHQSDTRSKLDTTASEIMRTSETGPCCRTPFDPHPPIVSCHSSCTTYVPGDTMWSAGRRHRIKYGTRRDPCIVTCPPHPGRRSASPNVLRQTRGMALLDARRQMMQWKTRASTRPR